MAVGCLLASGPAKTQVPTEAGPAFQAYNSAFLGQSNGLTYYTWGYQQSFDDVQWGWGQAFDLYPAEDHLEYTQNQNDRNLLNATLTSFLNTPSYIPDVSGSNADGWNDDIGWITEAFMRGYLVTGNQSYLTEAENGWNFVYNNRPGDPNQGGLDPVNGGIWENDTKYSKCALSNSSFVYSGVLLYQATGSGSYLSGAETIYSWERAHFVNTTGSNITSSLGTWAPGQVIGCVLANEQPQSYSNDIEDAGGFLTAASELYRVTGNQQYYNDAVLVINRIYSQFNPTGNPPTPLGEGGEDCACVHNYQFTRGLSDFLTATGGWWSSPYANWLLANAEAAWNDRDGYNLTWNQWSVPTTDSVPESMDSLSAAAVWSQLPPPTMNLAGTYEIQNVGSGLAVNVNAASNAAGEAVIQYPFSNGQPNALWTFVPTTGGYYQIKNVNSGQVLNVSGNSGQAGANGLIVQWPAQGFIPGNDQWMPVQNPDGTFSFYNLLSHLALDVPAASTASQTQFDQYFGNGTAAQKFNLIQPSLNLSGTFEIQNANSGLALNVSGGSTANNAPVIQYPFSNGETNAEWRFVPASPGYYRIQNVNSGLYVNVSGGSTAFGAPIIQWAASGTNNDQWRVVQNSDGTYSFYNANSTDALDVPAASTASNVQLDQWGENGTGAQKFNLISR